MTQETWLQFLAGCFGMLLGTAVPMAGAAETKAADADRQLDSVRKSIKTVEKSLSGLENQKDSLNGQLAELDRQYGELAKSRKDLETRAQAQNRQMAELTQRKNQLRDAALKQNRSLAGQTRAAYASGKTEWLKILLNQEDPARASRVLTYYTYLHRARLSQLQSLRGDIARLREVEDQMKAETERLEATRVSIKLRQTELEAARSQRQAVLAKLERSYADDKLRLRQLQDDARHLQGLIASIRQDAEQRPVVPPAGEPVVTAAPRAAMSWPVQGELLERFGAPRASGSWDGVLIGAREGMPVRAVAPGRVAFSDWLRGYGLLTIIDHGDGYMSLYAFNQSLYKGVGDWVVAGDVIASVGSSGGQAEPGLYFGIRERGRPIDPQAWRGRTN